MHAFECCAKAMIASRKCIVITPIMVTKKVVSDFAATSQGVMVVLEEVTLARDSQILVALLLPKRHARIVGILLVGDKHQAGTLVTSAAVLCNAFGRQLEVSSCERLKISGFPVHHLVVQYRAHPLWIEYANQRCYGGKTNSRRGSGSWWRSRT